MKKGLYGMNSSNSKKPNVLTLENLRKILYKNDKEETEASENSNDVETTKAVNKNQFEFIKSHFGSLKEYIFQYNFLFHHDHYHR